MESSAAGRVDRWDGDSARGRGTEGQKGPEVAWGVSLTHVLVQGLDLPLSEASPNSGELQERAFPPVSTEDAAPAEREGQERGLLTLLVSGCS